MNGIGKIEISLAADARRRSSFRDLMSGIERLATIGHAGGVEVLDVRGFDDELGRVRTIDLLSDKLVVQRQISRERPTQRELDPGSAHEAIKVAFAELRGEIENAVRVDADETTTR